MTSRSGKPAILGGEPVVTADHGPALRWPILTTADEEAVLAILRDGNLSTHAVIRELERDYRSLTGMPYALAHCNGTAAMLAAFQAIDLKPGDEVLVPSATFWASVLPMIWLGVIPVFCESEEARMGLDPADLERRITSRTRALVVVHLWGLPSRMTEIMAVARRHGLAIIEDASHAHGAIWRDRPCGSLGDVAVFSLQGDKLAPAGEGGVLLCRRESHHSPRRWRACSCAIWRKGTGNATRTSSICQPRWRAWVSTPSCRRLTSGGCISSFSCDPTPRK